jgi:lipopolysaccharide transport system ATP-binding protein
VQEGEALGVIGRNGAGKSTLLKVLSQITGPSEGSITLRGRVASLLEVGTGFHPELSGRENIYLNGAILGMTRKEITRKFDEIVAFAEVERFLDTPVKRYSSGMYVRLAFAVAAHLEPDILIVDEVLAVGDAEFQKKCLGKMGAVAKTGRTVLFVTHNMAAVSTLCTKALVLQHGSVVFSGDVMEGVRHYTSTVSMKEGGVRQFDVSSQSTEGSFFSAELLDQHGEPTSQYFMGDEMRLRFGVQLPNAVGGLRISFRVLTASGERVYHCVGLDNSFCPTLTAGRHYIEARLDKLALYPGTYVVDDLWMASGSGTMDQVADALHFAVEEGGTHMTRHVNPQFALVHEVPNWRVCDEAIGDFDTPARSTSL